MNYHTKGTRGYLNINALFYYKDIFDIYLYIYLKIYKYISRIKVNYYSRLIISEGKSC